MTPIFQKMGVQKVSNLGNGRFYLHKLMVLKRSESQKFIITTPKPQEAIYHVLENSYFDSKMRTNLSLEILENISKVLKKNRYSIVSYPQRANSIYKIEKFLRKSLKVAVAV